MAAANRSLAKEIRSIRTALRQLDRSFARIAVALATNSNASVTGRRKLRLTPARKAALKLQGQYMGLLRGLRPRQKSAVKRIRAEKGIRPAIAAAQRLSS